MEIRQVREPGATGDLGHRQGGLLEQSGRRTQPGLAEQGLEAATAQFAHQVPGAVDADAEMPGEIGQADVLAMPGEHVTPEAFSAPSPGQDGTSAARSMGCRMPSRSPLVAPSCATRRVYIHAVNFDQGYAYPADAADLTAARIRGVAQYRQRRYTLAGRPNYIAPAIGLRQGRQVECRYKITLDDLVTRRRFADCIGYTGGHYDNHAVDYEFESAEARFWVWACRQWWSRVACDIPYRAIVPVGLDNCWIASRCLGVSQDAHYALRMQRDLQRIGEVSGLTAAMAAKRGLAAIDVPLPELQAALRSSGALSAVNESDGFGVHADAGWIGVQPAQDLPALSDPSWDIAGPAMWRLARAPAAAADGLAELARSGDDPAAWRAACILAQRGDPAALAAGAVEAIALRHRPDAGEAAAAGRLLSLLEGVQTGSIRDPFTPPLRVADGVPARVADDERQPVRYDGRWQVRLAVLRARRAIGIASAPSDEDRSDHRLLVRRAFAGIAATGAARG